MCAAYVRELTAPDTVGLVSEKVAAGGALRLLSSGGIALKFLVTMEWVPEDSPGEHSHGYLCARPVYLLMYDHCVGEGDVTAMSRKALAWKHFRQGATLGKGGPGSKLRLCCFSRLVN